MPQDDFIIDDTQSAGTAVPDEPQTFSIGGQDYTAEQLSKYVELGKIGEEAETKYSTKIDRVWPEYTRTSQELKAAKERLAELEEIAEQAAQAPVSDTPQDEQIRQAKAAARKIGIVTDEDFENFMSQNFRKYYQVERESEQIYNDAKSLSEKYNGGDGRPAFDTVDMLQYMVDNEIKNPELAYKIRYEKELDAWKEAQLAKSKKPGMVTESGSSVSSKTPTDVKPTRDNLGELVREALGQTAE